MAVQGRRAMINRWGRQEYKNVAPANVDGTF
ncbi:hypothetical protein EYZ11_005545 [Aspergillus tanneri]|uniref:Uncharacterized protein n=1 Tax=Aspergillus tanneri TaxID=1220188 RepID=A0A4S3JI35_9EURO|nr:hypothetical protein EYZ11_005545 [Aspergillus tanneri]